MRSRTVCVGLSLFLLGMVCMARAGEQKDMSGTDSLTIVSFNLHGWQTEWPTRLGIILDELEQLQPDLIGFQEVLQTPGTSSIDNSARVIADSLFRRTGLSYSYFFARTHTAWDMYDEGIAILTRHIVLNSGARDLPPGVFARKVLYCRVLTPRGIIQFFDTHLAHLAEEEPVRTEQVKVIRAFVEEMSADGVPAANIICGDFNAIPGSMPLRTMTTADSLGVQYVDSWALLHPGQPGYTMPAESPNSRIDYIFLKDNERSTVTDSRLILNKKNSQGLYPSDHFGLASTLVTALRDADITILSPSPGERISGQATVVWSLEGQAGPLTMSIYYSSDAGKTWRPLWSGESEQSTYMWNTLSVPDGTRYLLRIVALGDSTFGLTQSSATFTVDNAGNAPPEIELEDPRGGELLEGDQEIRWTANDADENELFISLDVSQDDGLTWIPLAEDEPNDGSYLWDTRDLPNSPFYRIRLRCTDGTVEVTAISLPFTVQNDRADLAESLFVHVAGHGDGTVGGNIVDPFLLTNHLYRITFAPDLSRGMVYHVFDLDEGSYVLTGGSEMDGLTEGSAFDGMRLIIFDYPQAIVDQPGSGWEIGHATLSHTITLPELNFGTEIIRGYPYPADYRLQLYDHVVDTSSSFLGALPGAVHFTVRNVTEDRPVEVIFNEVDRNGQIGRNEEIYILETDDLGQALLTWLIFFAGSPSVTLPQSGDVFVLSTLKPFASDDVFEFTTAPASDKGDINDDGRLNVLDVVAMVRHILDLDLLAGSKAWRADVNGDRLVNSLDVVAVVSIILQGGHES